MRPWGVLKALAQGLTRTRDRTTGPGCVGVYHNADRPAPRNRKGREAMTPAEVIDLALLQKRIV
jgi:hypothetical protein